ncbi:MAG: radical SAM protein [Nanoarchaeota archaeon]|nr:radical SAM protein [Nanoarchaeota archaeon]
MKKTPYFSWNNGNLPKGCQLCVQGKKLVLFITGLCPRCCYYCPISDKKYGQDVIYADEWKVTNVHQIIKEAKLIDAKGAGITGGDPLCKLERTLSYIKRLKKEFGKGFHIHLYSSLDLVDEKTLKKLYSSGLDEIRFHLDFDDSKLWSKVSLAKEFKWDVGVEVPVIPGKVRETKKLIDFLSGKIDFLNINELEIADNKFSKLTKLGFKTKDELSYAVKGSEELALKLLKYSKGKVKNVHYCTATLKDKVQLANRIKRRAKNIAKQYDIINKDGTLTRGSIYLKELKPSARYSKKLQNINKTKKNKIIKELNKIRNQLKKDFNIENKQIEVDTKKLRIITSIKIVNKIKDDINRSVLENCIKDKNTLKSPKDLYLAIVTEYPTYDGIILDLEFL